MVVLRFYLFNRGAAFQRAERIRTAYTSTIYFVCTSDGRTGTNNNLYVGCYRMSSLLELNMDRESCGGGGGGLQIVQSQR